MFTSVICTCIVLRLLRVNFFNVILNLSYVVNFHVNQNSIFHAKQVRKHTCAPIYTTYNNKNPDLLWSKSAPYFCTGRSHSSNFPLYLPNLNISQSKITSAAINVSKPEGMSLQRRTLDTLTSFHGVYFNLCRVFCKKNDMKI